MRTKEQELNERAYRRLRDSIDESYPNGHFVVIARGEIIGGFATSRRALKASKGVSQHVLIVRAGKVAIIPKLPYKPLSSSLKRLLRYAVKTGVIADANSGAIAELIERGLCDSQSRLTDWGKTEAVSLCSLKIQCAVLGLPHEIWPLPRGGKPEYAVMDAIKTDDCKAAYCEGGAIYILLYCLCFDRLLGIATERWGSAKAAESWLYAGIPYSHLLERQPNLLAQMVEDIGNANESDLVRSYAVLKGWQRQPGYPPAFDGWALRNWVGVDRDLIVAIFHALGSARCASIAKWYFTEPYKYTSGWPDLVWVENSKVGMIEVKTTDKLFPGQIRTFSAIKDAVQVPVKVVQVQWQ